MLVDLVVNQYVSSRLGDGEVGWNSPWGYERLIPFHLRPRRWRSWMESTLGPWKGSSLFHLRPRRWGVGWNPPWGLGRVHRLSVAGLGYGGVGWVSTLEPWKGSSLFGCGRGSLVSTLGPWIGNILWLRSSAMEIEWNPPWGLEILKVCQG